MFMIPIIFVMPLSLIIEKALSNSGEPERKTIRSKR